MPRTDLETALGEHVDWLGRLMAAHMTGRVGAALLHETAECDCAFGKWLLSAVPESDEDGAALALVGDLHATMHHAARDLLDDIGRAADTEVAFTALLSCVLAFNAAVRRLRLLKSAPRDEPAW